MLHLWHDGTVMRICTTLPTVGVGSWPRCRHSDHGQVVHTVSVVPLKLRSHGTRDRCKKFQLLFKWPGGDGQLTDLWDECCRFSHRPHACLLLTRSVIAQQASIRWLYKCQYVVLVD